MANYASKAIAVADAEVGYIEKASDSQLYSKTANAGNKNYTKFGKELKKLSPKVIDYPAPWCDQFVDWVMYKAFGKEAAKKLLCGDFDDYTPFSAKYYKNKGRYYKSNPKVGDQIFFKNSSGTICHTGLVYKVTSTKVYTIEGNTSGASGVIANGGGVCKKSYSLSYSRIDGYGRPAYDPEPGTSAPTKAPSSSASKTMVMAKDAAGDFQKSLAGTYKVTASSLNVRTGAGTKKTILTAIPKGTKVQNYGYYTNVSGTKWLYVQFIYDGVTYVGFCSSKYLRRA